MRGLRPKALFIAGGVEPVLTLTLTPKSGQLAVGFEIWNKKMADRSSVKGEWFYISLDPCITNKSKLLGSAQHVGESRWSQETGLGTIRFKWG